MIFQRVYDESLLLAELLVSSVNTQICRFTGRPVVMQREFQGTLPQAEAR